MPYRTVFSGTNGLFWLSMVRQRGTGGVRTVRRAVMNQVPLALKGTERCAELHAFSMRRTVLA